MERSKLKLCKFYDSGRIKKASIRKNKKGTIQRYQCKYCKRRFTTNFGFEHTRYDSDIITHAMQTYYQGNSVRDIVNGLEMIGVDVSHVAVYQWIAKYSAISDEFLNTIIPQVGNWCRSDIYSTRWTMTLDIGSLENWQTLNSNMMPTISYNKH